MIRKIKIVLTATFCIVLLMQLAHITITGVYADSTDQHQDNHDGNNRSINKSQVWLGELFTPTVTANITQFCINAYTSNGFTNGTFTVEIYATSSHLPTGSVLTSGTLSSASFPSSATSTKTCISLTATSLSSGTQYAAVFKSDINDGSRYYILQATTSPSPTPASNDSSIYSLDGSTWNQNTGEWFAYSELYSGAAPTATPTPTPTPTATPTPTTTPTPTPTPASNAVPITADPLVSLNLPAYTSDDCSGSYPASRADDNNYSNYWRSCAASPSAGTPVTLSYDISSLSTNQKNNIDLVWFNDYATATYDYTLNNSTVYNQPRDYTIQANSGTGGGSPPASGWVTLATVTGNTYHSRQHKVDLTGYNWVRMSVTASNGSSLNYDVEINMDLHTGSATLTDDWLMLGDSITLTGLLNDSSNGNSFSQQINASNSAYFPIAESGGIGGFESADGKNNISTWLTNFPGHFVTLNYGTNDALQSVSPSTFYSNMATMVQDIINAGKIPIIPTIPWGCTTNLTANVTGLNAEVQQLYTDYPKIIKGPDLYTYFKNNPGPIQNNDCIHPAADNGWTLYRQQWVQAMVSAVYTVPTLSVSPSGGNYTSKQSVTLTSSKTGTIYYTTDGSTPTTSSSIYSSPLNVSTTKTIKAITVDQAGNQSALASNTYTFSSSSSSSASSPTNTTQSNGSSPNPNFPSGWNAPINFGTHFIGNAQFVSGASDASQAKTFISPDAVQDDIHVDITNAPISELMTQIPSVPLPWNEGLNTVSNIYLFSAKSAFNGYPLNQFLKPVTVILPYNSTLTTGKKLFIAEYNPILHDWQILKNTLTDFQNQTVAATTNYYSYFAVISTKPANQPQVTALVVPSHSPQNPVLSAYPTKPKQAETPKITPRNNKSTNVTVKSKFCILFFCI